MISFVTSGVPQQIILNQGQQNNSTHLLQQNTQQNIQVIHPIQQQAGTATTHGATSRPTQATADPATQAKLATKQKLQKMLAALKSGTPQSPEEKRQLIMLLKVNKLCTKLFALTGCFYFVDTHVLDFIGFDTHISHRLFYSPNPKNVDFRTDYMSSKIDLGTGS